MTKSISLLFTIGLITLGFLGVVGLTGCMDRPPCPTSRIKTVGGCTKDGLCGVMLEDGTETDAIRPVAGGRVYHYSCRTVQ